MSSEPMLIEPLTERELQIIQLIIKGLSNREIADKVILAPSTIKWYVRQINQKLGTANRAEIISFVEQHGILPKQEPSVSSQTITDTSHLPSYTTPFIGRKNELAEIVDYLMHTHTRLLTILAAGGMGKTRLAIALAEHQAQHFKDGVYFIALRPLQSANQIIPEIANNIGCDIQIGEKSSLEQLGYYLHSQEVLLVLDNCEHLIDAMPIINDLLMTAPKVKIVATSRQRLNLSGEIVYVLNGMSFPQAESLDDLKNADAIQFIVNCANRFRIGWELTNANKPHVMRLCRLTGGMPLAIILATSWFEVFELEQICDRIQRDLTLLETQLQDVPERHSSIQVIFEQAWQQLTTSEQDGLIRMSVFQGSFDVSAAEKVAQATPQILQNLSNKALLIREHQGRYSMHELLRQYINKKALTYADRIGMHQAHAHYYANLIDSMTSQLVGLERLNALLTIEADFPNIQQAWEWACQHKDYFLINRMVTTLNIYCVRRARFPDFKTMMQVAHRQFLVDDETIPLSVKARLWRTYSDSCHIFAEKRAATIQALDYARQADDPREIAYALAFLGIYDSEYNADGDKALAYLEEALALCYQLNEYPLANLTLRHIGDIYIRYHEDVVKSEAALRQAITIAQDNQYLFGLAAAKEHLAYLRFYYQYDPEQAIVLYQDANQVFQQMGDHYNTASTTSALALIYNHLGNDALATYHGEILQQIADLTRNPSSAFLAAYVQAQLHFMRGEYTVQYEMLQQTEKQVVIEDTYKHLLLNQEALALCGLQQYEGASTIALNNMRYFMEGDKIQLVTALFSMCLILAYHKPVPKLATQCMALIQHHYPAAINWAFQPLAQHLYRDLRNVLSDDDFGEAWHHGQQQDLQSLCQQILIKLE